MSTSSSPHPHLVCARREPACSQARRTHAILVYSVLLWYWTSILWPIDTCQNKVSAEKVLHDHTPSTGSRLHGKRKINVTRLTYCNQELRFKAWINLYVQCILPFCNPWPWSATAPSLYNFQDPAVFSHVAQMWCHFPSIAETDVFLEENKIPSSTI